MLAGFCLAALCRLQPGVGVESSASKSHRKGAKSALVTRDLVNPNPDKPELKIED